MTTAHTGGSAADGELACAVCGEPTGPDRGRLTLWFGERLFVIEDVPARVCRGCGETFYAEDALRRVEKLQGAASDRPEPVRVVEAPVYAWGDL